MKIKTSQKISQEYNVTMDGMIASKKWVAVDDLIPILRKADMIDICKLVDILEKN